jgi:hypothetical protein
MYVTRMQAISMFQGRRGDLVKIAGTTTPACAL